MTPMFEQYLALKAQHPSSILFFRMGDFYEMFYEDAELAARELDLTLTARNKQQDNPIPMAGVPHHASAGYIERLVERGFRVAIAEQVEDPRKAKGLVKREVVRVVTPGLTLDPTTLPSRAPCWMAAIHVIKDVVGMAFLDASTGEFRCAEVGTLDAAAAELARMEVREALLSPQINHAGIRAAAAGAVMSEVSEEAWTPEEAQRELRDTLGIHDLSGLGLKPADPAACAAGAVLRYARDILGKAVGNVHDIQFYQPSGFMVLDDTTRRNLELTKTLIGGRRKGSLLSLLDRACTSAGSRLLRDWLMFPLLDIERIWERQRGVGVLVDRNTEAQALRVTLRQVADIARISARIAQSTAHARDLGALRRSLLVTPEVARQVAELDGLDHGQFEDLCGDLAEDLDRWLVDDPPISVMDGGLLRPEADSELQRLVQLQEEGATVLAELEERERGATGIPSLKVRNNRVFGYYIEITKAHVHKAPDHYMRKQTLTNCERYITAELKELEESILGADQRRKELEYERFSELRGRVSHHIERLQQLAESLAAVDALCALADCAVRYRWRRPEVGEGTALRIQGGRHPVVEHAMDEARFVPNDMDLDTEHRQLIVLTGPNMSGKSTIMRQVALIALLAQMGSFVPADAAEVGVCDRIFTRVGAADDLASGQSTFMVEMAETSAILHHATNRSLVILDEIGRGTSTYDGLSIAWAVAEDLTDRIGCRTLFATHYHELCELAEGRSGVVNQSVAVSDLGDEIIFLRQLREGGASRSYGIQCARLAGLPRHVVDRASRLLRQFEKYAPRNEREQLSLFGGRKAPSTEEPPPELASPEPDELRMFARSLDPDSMTPRQALDALYQLRSLTDKEE